MSTTLPNALPHTLTNTLRSLRLDDAAALLDFELANRAWFERFTEPRPDDFYSMAGVEQHIEECLAARRRRVMHPCLLYSPDGVLLGRANLRNINTVTRSGDLGYRIGEAHIGRGVATDAVSKLLVLARTGWHLNRLSAFVVDENTASMRVLEKNGFTKMGLFPEFSELRGRLADCYEFLLTLE